MVNFPQKNNSFYCLRDANFTNDFPSTNRAMTEPDGLLAAGGSLKTTNLLAAYKKGIFPWYSGDGPILWWSPKMRPIIEPAKMKISRSLHKTIKSNKYSISYNQCFEKVITSCAAIDGRSENSWITSEMRDSYIALHHLGHAHSVECWMDGVLSGGLYGVSLGRIFYGESMFHKERDASKVALADLCKNLASWGYKIVDCQVSSEHLKSMGARLITREEFETILVENLEKEPDAEAWRIN